MNDNYIFNKLINFDCFIGISPENGNTEPGTVFFLYGAFRLSLGFAGKNRLLSGWE